MLVQQGGDEAAKLLSAPTPMYNDEAKRLNVTGEVVLEVKMRASGEVQVLRIVSSLGHGLDQAAIDAVNQTRCRPALKAGRPVDVMATVRVIFKLA
jgi:TonB family protein